MKKQKDFTNIFITILMKLIKRGKNMKLKNHCIIATITITAWFSFYLLGIPSDYFQQWSFAEQTLLTLVTIFGIVPFVAFCIIILFNKNYIKTGIWLAFYASVPLIILNFVTGIIIQRYGVSFFISHWYLTLGYFYAWIIGQLMGYTLQKFKCNINS